MSSSALSNKRKEPSESEVRQKEFLSQLFDAKNSSVVTRLQSELPPAAKKAKVEPSSNPFVKAMDEKPTPATSSGVTTTQNGAVSLATTNAPNLDLFYHMARGYTPEAMAEELPAAWAENPETTLKVLCHARDCHSSGKGERLIVYHALMWLRKNKPRTYVANLTTFLSHGYFKDLCNLVEMIDRNGKAAFKPRTKKQVKQLGDLAAPAEEKSTSSIGSVGPIGNANFELQLFAEYLKADYAKLRKWRAAKKAAKAAGGAAASTASTESPEVDESFVEVEDGEWTEIADDVTAQVEQLDIKEDQASSSSAAVPAAPALVAPHVPSCLISLAAKYAPTERHHFASQANRLADILFPQETNSTKSRHASLKKYRVLLSALRSHLMITEKLTCSGRWDRINFNTVPAKCHQILKKAFMKHTPEKYSEYLAGLKKGVGKIRVTGLQPHELVDYYLKGGDLDETVEAAWKELVAKTKEAGTFKAAISVVDVSGSMSGTPMIVAIAMGLLVAELCEGDYHGRVLTFHESPSWHEITGETLKERVLCLSRARWGGSTNLLSTFDLILETAVAKKISSEHLPQTLFIYSDMQFDQAMGENWMQTNYQAVVSKYAAAGYPMPGIVFWNLNGAINRDTPVQCDQAGCALMSGFSATLLNVFLKAPIVPEPTPTEEGEEAPAAEDPAKNPLHPLRIMMDSLEEYVVTVDESER